MIKIVLLSLAISLVVVLALFVVAKTIEFVVYSDLSPFILAHSQSPTVLMYGRDGVCYLYLYDVSYPYHPVTLGGDVVRKPSSDLYKLVIRSSIISIYFQLQGVNVSNGSVYARIFELDRLSGLDIKRRIDEKKIDVQFQGMSVIDLKNYGEILKLVENKSIASASLCNVNIPRWFIVIYPNLSTQVPINTLQVDCETALPPRLGNVLFVELCFTKNTTVYDVYSSSYIDIVSAVDIVINNRTSSQSLKHLVNTLWFSGYDPNLLLNYEIILTPTTTHFLRVVAMLIAIASLIFIHSRYRPEEYAKIMGLAKKVRVWLRG